MGWFSVLKSGSVISLVERVCEELFFWRGTEPVELGSVELLGSEGESCDGGGDGDSGVDGGVSGGGGLAAWRPKSPCGLPSLASSWDTW